jgi:hypothetical protein
LAHRPQQGTSCFSGLSQPDHSEPESLVNCRDIGDMSEKGIHERAIWNGKYKEGCIIDRMLNAMFPVSIELIPSSRQIVESDQTHCKYPDTSE